MSSTGILTEYGLGERLTQADINRFIEQGVPPIYLARTWSGTFAFLQRDRVRIDGDRFEFGRYLPHADGADLTYAFTFILFDSEGQPADIAAWRPPELALWLGRVWALGQEQVEIGRLGEPLRVHGGVLDWLRTGREGVVILNYPLAAWELRCTGTLAVETRAAADQLAELLTIPPPPIVVSPYVSIEPDQHDELHGVAA